MIAVGIDPGKTGAIAIIPANGPVRVHDMPYIGKDVNVKALEECLGWLRMGADVKACVELQQVFPQQGAVSAFTLGEGYGMIKGWLVGSAISFFTVRPVEWKKVMGIPPKSDKSISRMVAARLFPDVDLGRRADQGRADALLIAEYCRRTYQSM